ncbi:MAG: DNA-directed RNA polymerase subunit omega [Myxococcales bacterium]|nr:DNA-directed RNA polymerase subunit omega [Myxococcales bacterium]|tara:strand:+ start:2516 stop:2779 length:264 start_codon:yes stop_codon:yes gene_type:complete
MARVTVEDCLEQIPNRFALVLLASSRTRQLMKGSRSLVDHQRNKEPVMALREVADKKVYFDRPVNDVLDKTVSQLQADFEALHASEY